MYCGHQNQFFPLAVCRNSVHPHHLMQYQSICQYPAPHSQPRVHPSHLIQKPAPLGHWLHVESLSINVNGTGDKRQLQHPLGMGLAYCKANSRYNCTGIKQLATIGFIPHSPIASPTRNPEVMLQMPSPCPQNTQRMVQKTNTHPQIQYQ